MVKKSSFTRSAIGLVALSLVITGKLFAQKSDTGHIAVTKFVTIHSTILNEDRKLHIYTPAVMGDSSFNNEPMPVLYVMDAEALSALVSSQVNYLSINYGLLPRMIVVSTCNYSYDRIHDLTPTHFITGYEGKPDSSFKTSGGGEKFLQFMREEVIPYVEKHYKTQPFRVFAGHSLGGLMTTYCLFHYPDMFNAYLAISPALWVNNDAGVADAASKMKSPIAEKKFFFMSDGNEGERFHTPVAKLDSLISSKKLTNFNYQFIHYNDESHGSEPVKAFYDGLRLIYRRYELSPADTTALSIQKHYSDLAAAYGYHLLPPEVDINAIAYYWLSKSWKMDDAIALFRMNTISYPMSFNAYDSLGDGYAKKGDKVKAIENYRKAIALKPDLESTRKKLAKMTQ
ncbi:alpha/beta hydrolase-fold protein [Mucilaginibacter celer]|uniref:Uncharacterized protein n=1 Tax=Mucilaginibacter celer TaxID=2305508 RepID=A0A494VV63_9SPHI|nr:alpha/beta hydrolase-fold protein [Mucilaginibacter celer]AYL95178.1 hypothetical protein HYN43_007665 [Mucilaginibacter celer]